MSRLVCCVVTSLWLLVGCGKDDDTKFCDTDDVRAYRTALNPLIEAVSAIEREVGERAIGVDSVAIDSRIAPVYLELQPRLLAVQQALVGLRPPRKLADMHDDIKMLVQLRLDAYQLVIDGFAAGDISVYPRYQCPVV
jgi:hypothetical protein